MSSLNLDSVESRVLPVKSRQTVLRVLEDSEGETRDQPFCRLRRIVRCEVRTDQSEHLITGIRVVPLRIERFRREGHGHGDGNLLAGKLRAESWSTWESRGMRQRWRRRFDALFGGDF